MNTISRGIRNAFRNVVRTFSIVVILGLSIGLALAMLVARASVQDKIETVKTSIGNTIDISPAGAQGFMGGGEPLKSEELDKIAKLPNVVSVKQSLIDRLTADNSDLESAIEPGTIGNRGAANSGVGFMSGGAQMRFDSAEESGQPVTRTFTPPVEIRATNSLADASAYGGDSVTYTSGQALDPTKDENVAVVGKSLAEKNSLTVGSTFTAYNTAIKVVGIFDSGNVFSNGGVIMSLSSLQRLSEQAGSATSATVTVNSIDNMDSVVTAVESTLGNAADVVSNKDSADEAVAPLESVKTISTFSLIGAVAAGAVIILLTMVMIVRERRREIGVFKAIGASNIKVMTQFVSEAVTLTVLALMAGLIIGSVSAAPLTRILVNNSNSSQNADNETDGPQTVSSMPGGGQVFRISSGGPAGRLRGFGNDTISNARNVQASVGTEILAYGLATAFLIAIIGSAIPALLISKIRPAEVMRAE